jgi:hypothetical protein
MGAWGAGSFENDMAMDWAAGVSSVDDVQAPFARLKRETDAHEGEGELLVDADFACELLAAAECVAFMLGRRSADFPEELEKRLGHSVEPDNLLFHQARNAVLHVMRNSELAEFWEESAAESGGNEWLAVLTNLIDRLNPEIEDEWAFLSGAPRDRGEPTAIVGTCAFCDGPIERQHLWSMHVDDAYNPGRAGKKSYELHLQCLNARLHHKHAIADFKFDPDNMPDLDQL